MSRLEVQAPEKVQGVVEQLYHHMDQRIVTNPPGLCPVEVMLNFLSLCQTQTCGKCVPCRIGLTQLSNMLRDVLDGEANLDTLTRIETTARAIMDSADCAIGIDAGKQVLLTMKAFRDDYEEHILRNRCKCSTPASVPCVAHCPAGVDIPGYIALVNEGRCDDAVRLIRKDNPLPVSCAYICEHPCEERCRRNAIDDALNIRGLKRYAVDQAGDVPQPKPSPSTGKCIAVVGAGPGGLTAAYYLALMGHKVTIYEKRKQLGGMMRYGIPSYRFPRELMDAEIQSILSMGIEVHTNCNVGTDISFQDLRAKYDCIYLSIGAHADKKLGIEGEGSIGVVSAVEMLRNIGDGEMPDFSGKNVVVVGGGNVAMDVTRSAVRLGAEKVTCVYRRRQEDMTAQAIEVEGAIAESAEVLPLHAPLRVEADAEGRVVALWVQPQIIGEMDSYGRPRPNTASTEPIRIPADMVVVAIGQDIDLTGFEDSRIKFNRNGTIVTDACTNVEGVEGVFAGGDCVTGPATVIRAIAAGKTAAANIDDYLGYRHEIQVDVEIPKAHYTNLHPCGRIDALERESCERKCDFDCMEYNLTDEEAAQESSRCLRCDHFGFGNFKGGRVVKW